MAWPSFLVWSLPWYCNKYLLCYKNVLKTKVRQTRMLLQKLFHPIVGIMSRVVDTCFHSGTSIKFAINRIVLTVVMTHYDILKRIEMFRLHDHPLLFNLSPWRSLADNMRILCLNLMILKLVYRLCSQHCPNCGLCNYQVTNSGDILLNFQI